MSDTPPEVPIEGARQSLFERASIVWIVPLGALLIALGVAWNAYSERGPLIEISFENAEGIGANETELKYRNVSVGVVEAVRFTDTLDRVLVSVRLDKEVAAFVDAESEFWVVRPEVSASGVSGLETVLSGVFIEGAWDSEIGEPATRFEGLDDAPVFTPSSRGLRFELRTSRQEGLTDNTPILYKGIEVGRIGSARISQDGQWIFAEAIIFEPHDRLITSATRFWDTSGFSLNIGPNGAELAFSSVASLISGGITFDTLVSGGQRVRSGTVFEIFPDEAAARNSVFEENDGTTVTLSAIFSENVSGLSTGAPVEWRGVRVGEVLNVTGLIDPDRFGDERVRLLVAMDVRPGRFGLQGDQSEETALAFLEERVEAGLRARLATASILTGGLKIEFVQVEEPPGEARLEDADPFPLMPVTDAAVSDVTASAEGVLERVAALPIEGLLDSAINFLDSGTAFVTSENVRETPAELRGLLADARGVIGSDEVQAIPGEVAAILGDIRLASADLRRIVTALEEADAVSRLVTAIDDAGAAARSVETTLNDLQPLTDRLVALADKANALPLEELLAEVTGLAEDGRGLIASDAAQVLPERFGEALDSLNAILTDIDEAGAADRLTAALSAAEDAARGVENSVAGVPELVERIDAIAADIGTVPFEQVANDLSEVLATANRLIGDATAERLPAALAGALSQAEAALADLNEAGIVATANQTLEAAERAAEAVAEAADGLPQLVARANAAIAQAETTLQGYQTNSPFAREVQTALRDIQAAADAVTSLSRALERRPNSIILGR
ncbi:MCE family protein [Alphaproteobacteria bacterium GH1-50]|uniref:MCE family protein n=1 Tax=Kangsaoukella pontilimi TaxID=2691042 RepID=A0A7C9IPI5_9RHOB|nr:MlaD family protein [Kangsaoukella pontilimi]MXQ06883.1 MCE family protein [Kangsaoukella pontilimi]